MKCKDFRVRTFPPENHIIGSRLLKQNSILVIGGPPKSMKSMLSMGIAIDLCCGRPLWGATHSTKEGRVATFPVSKPRRVLYMEMEVGEEDCLERLNAMLKSLSSAELDLVDENLHIVSCNLDWRLDTTDGTKAIEKEILKARPEVTILDPLVEFLVGLDENSTHDMGVALRNLDILRYRHKFATILDHHCGKADKRGDIIDSLTPEALRGSSRLHGKIDSALMLQPQFRFRAGFLYVTPWLRRGKPLDTFRLQLNDDTLLASFQGWADEPPTSKQAAASTKYKT